MYRYSKVSESEDENFLEQPSEAWFIGFKA